MITESQSDAVKSAMRALLRAWEEIPCFCDYDDGKCYCASRTITDALSRLMEEFPVEGDELEEEEKRAFIEENTANG